jgi:hypothetical protein
MAPEVSTTGAVMVAGSDFGPRMEAFLRLHRQLFWLWAAVVVTLVLVLLRRSPARPIASLAKMREP